MWKLMQKVNAGLIQEGSVRSPSSAQLPSGVSRTWDSMERRLKITPSQSNLEKEEKTGREHNSRFQDTLQSCDNKTVWY